MLNPKVLDCVEDIPKNLKCYHYKSFLYGRPYRANGGLPLVLAVLRRPLGEPGVAGVGRGGGEGGAEHQEEEEGGGGHGWGRAGEEWRDSSLSELDPRATVLMHFPVLDNASRVSRAHAVGKFTYYM